MVPRQLCKAVLHHCRVRPGGREGPQVLQVPRGVAPRVREPFPQVRGQPVDDPGAPALLVLPGQDVGADRSVRRQQLAVGGSAPLLTVGDPGGHRRQQRRVPAGQRRGARWHRELRPGPGGGAAGRPAIAHWKDLRLLRRMPGQGPRCPGSGPRDDPGLVTILPACPTPPANAAAGSPRCLQGAARRSPGTDVSGGTGHVSGGGDNCS